MKQIYKYIFKLAVLLAVVGSAATSAEAQLIVRKDSVATARRAELEKEKVIVGDDTVSVILPERNFGRYDRGLYNYLFIPKGKWALGLTASYGELTTEDTQLLGVLKDLDFSGKIYSINPTISYFVRHNQSIGLKLTYSRGVADLASLSLDFDDDLNFSIKDVSYYTESFAMGTFYRNYVGLGSQRRFGVFNEISLMFQTGSSRFKRLFNDEPHDTRTTISQGSLNFSPGVAVFLQQNAAFNVSFGAFGMKLRHEKQTTNGTEEGSRTTSGANFKFNIFNINFGLLVVI
jgi:hypothetical protein